MLQNNHGHSNDCTRGVGSRLVMGCTCFNIWILHGVWLVSVRRRGGAPSSTRGVSFQVSDNSMGRRDLRSSDLALRLVQS